VPRATASQQDELLRLVIEQVDDARDLLQLAEQLAPLLPIKSFDDLLRGGEKGRMRFRDTPFDVSTLRPYVPVIAFPIEDLRGLVERLGYLVRLVPEHMGVDISTPEGMRRQMRRSATLIPGLDLGARRGFTAIVREPAAEPQPIPAPRDRAE
jgi:hypothetical protein